MNNRENLPAIIHQIRYIVPLSILISTAGIFLFNFEQYIFQALILPGCYLLYFYIIYKFYSESITNTFHEVNILKKDKKSFYDFLMNMGVEVKDPIDFIKIYRLIITTAVESTGADAGGLFIVEEHDDVLNLKYSTPDFIDFYNCDEEDKNISGLPSTTINIGENLLGQTVQKGQAIFIKSTFSLRSKKSKLCNGNIRKIKSLIAIPLIYTNRSLGVIALYKKAESYAFNDEHFKYLKMLVEYVSITLYNLYSYMNIIDQSKIERELSIANRIQKKLVPKQIPVLDNISTAVKSVPVLEVNSDYYDIVKLSDSKIGVIIADVASKGIAASYVKAMLRGLFHVVASHDRDPATVLRWINKGLAANTEIDPYATLSYFIYDKVKREITYSNAAHIPLLVYKHKLQKIFEIDTIGLPLGIDKATKYTSKTASLEANDIVISYTDGLIEAMNDKGELFSLDRLKNIVTDNIMITCGNIIMEIHEQLSAFLGHARLRDDYTIIVMKIK